MQEVSGSTPLSSTTLKGVSCDAANPFMLWGNAKVTDGVFVFICSAQRRPRRRRAPKGDHWTTRVRLARLPITDRLFGLERRRQLGAAPRSQPGWS